ncbi:hypothetical protein N7499_001824 [Penicillium canescens]|uniref:Uncharacterized protein n=1 Tax=Penicillium canescens TaxID=5083 RepID=A0AAD6I7E5_PENCN|nr:uncharacterized protein N7446_009358 [Penicillium canescens]KAJ6002313.1 hypothetical protein N7522_007540 [Penicillium canescens]KAJ6034605.1 hypothetical protein N7460_008780 [Penicillium canescens]KAJ6046266.1 hypothetical protein N7444_007520 [Penicillium canescens]KAJ6053346.1 hypothetical protein N7446_009358 [Penicillium canescens]KAJ6097450.1 hypothetical protein N7499_001824 [Penicillium canescens]
MADTPHPDSWQPSPEMHALLFTDFNGDPADPDDVIADALDGGYAERTPALLAILQDASADPAERLLACVALTSWADPAGYQAVIAAAVAPDEVVWRGRSHDRFFSQDDTFGQLADAVSASEYMVDERGTADLRIDAARALLAIADQVQFDRHIGRLLYGQIIDACQGNIRSTLDRGIHRIATDDHISFDLGLQLALLAVALYRVDELAATDAMRRLTAANPGNRARRELAEVTGNSSWLEAVD